ncbi:hypothetical protein KUTeg_002014, partial [Tegillarca granosa]
MYMVAIFILGIIASTSGFCPTYWRYFDKHCYIITKAKVTWNQARLNRCDYKTYSFNKWFKEQAFHSGERSYWIGASDLQHEGTFRWEGTGQTVRFTDWSPYQPDNYKRIEDCAHLWKNYGYRWNDTDCRSKISYICQRKAK